VKQEALELGLTVSHSVDDLLTIEPPIELGVVVAFGALIKPHVLARIPMVNLHFSLLPRWRGAAPVERALLAGDAETGVCLMQIEEGLDTGGVMACARRSISSDTTLDELRRDLVADGIELLISGLSGGLLPVVPQSGEPTYATKISSDDLRIGWEAPVEFATAQVRVGGAWTLIDGRRLKIHRAAASDVHLPIGQCAVDGQRVLVGCSRGSLELLSVQPEGKSVMSARDWANGSRPHGRVFDK
jgi:methionyl-tRNA formyltransferase